MKKQKTQDRKITDPFPTPIPKIDNAKFKKEMEQHMDLLEKIGPDFAKEVKQMIEKDDAVLNLIQHKKDQLKPELVE